MSIKNNNFAKIKPINLFGFLIEYTITNEGFPIIFYSKDKSLFKKYGI